SRPSALYRESVFRVTSNSIFWCLNSRFGLVNDMQESLDVSKLFVPGQQTPAAAASQLRRSSVDSLSRSRRGSSDMAARLEVDLKSHMFQPASPRAGPVSPIPFPPCFSGDISEDLEAQVDDKVTIACIVHGHPKPEVAWHKDGVLLLQNSHGIELWSQGFEHRLVIPYVGHEHAGVYCIAAANSLGQAECHCVISVIDEPADSGVEMLAASAASLDTPAARGCCTADCLVPPELLSLFRDRYCRAGEPVTLECEVAASPAPKVAWSFNGQPIDSSDRRFTVSSRGRLHRLRLARATPAESGRICLAAENDAGSATCGALLIVEDPDSGRVCSQKVIRASTKLFNRRAEKPSRDWQTTPGYSLVT
ncbi:hypothetical protein BOX15_Mlig001069g2, partial [Macrostomum lignano]